MASEPPHEVYNFNNLKRGSAVIFNNVDFVKDEKREGSDKDTEKLKKAFRRLGFATDDIYLERNKTTVDMEKFLENCLKNEAYDQKNSDCFVCVILTHGDYQEMDNGGEEVMTDMVCGTNGPMPLNNLIEKVVDCKALAGKPKIFMVQACRGTMLASQPVEVTHLETAKQQTPGPNLSLSGTQPAGVDAVGESPRIEKDTEKDTEKEDIESAQTKMSSPSPDLSETHATEVDSKGVAPRVEKDTEKDTEKEDIETVQTKSSSPNPGLSETQAAEVDAKGVAPRVEKDMEKEDTVKNSLPYEIPVSKDCVLIYATQPGFVSFRQPTTGTPFIKHFCSQVKQNGSNLEFMRLLTRVSRDVAYSYEANVPKSDLDKKKMMPWIASRLTKDVVFSKDSA